MSEQIKPKLGRPESRVIKLDATPEEAARAIFSAVKKPDPSLRIPQADTKTENSKMTKT